MDLSSIAGLTNGTSYGGDQNFPFTPPAAGPSIISGNLKLRGPAGGNPVVNQPQSITIDLSVITWLTSGVQYWADFLFPYIPLLFLT